jgi:hypothetical protein
MDNGSRQREMERRAWPFLPPSGGIHTRGSLTSSLRVNTNLDGFAASVFEHEVFRTAMLNLFTRACFRKQSIWNEASEHATKTTQRTDGGGQPKRIPGLTEGANEMID